ncbi:aldehyde dehydrogenase family protein [Aneurinibacillus tyrosinisolvens]|uniref:aldehyde dehydrogenase family protein n=1 Tax=Aneurinibacillus tyrosinisolvens TaxID=1443435 RepID=UPI00063F14A2|nr:aldehyde dehydrogenase family protein [Aneurinibacillus tyrosinisolvens]
MAITTGTKTYKNLINGEWTVPFSEQYFESSNPANKEESLGQFPASNIEDAERAIVSARQAQKSWAAYSPSKKAAILYKAADLLEDRAEEYGRELTREEGKILSQAIMEVKRSAQTLRYYASEGLNVTGATIPSDDGSFVYTKMEPLGVVSVITPWNFPISIPARKIAPALVTGNTVIFKPASETPLSALRLVECLHEAGLPAGVLNFITGSASKIGNILVSHPEINAVTFTGSTYAGEQIHKAASFKTRLQLELGGKNPLIVMDDANIDEAVSTTIAGGFSLTGQACTGTSRVLVMESVYDSYVQKLVEATEKLTVGDGMEEGVKLGPLANAKQLETVLEYVEIGKAEGATLLTGGQQLTDGKLGNGYYVSPAIFVDVTPGMRMVREEIFGPVIAVMKVSSLNEGIQLANDTEYGLAAAICTSNEQAISRFIQEIEAGMVKVNKPTTGVAYNVPFGGVKNSSTATYRESGRDALAFYVQSKTVYR